MHDREKIKQLRAARGLTVGEAAKLAGMRLQQWSNIESGHTGAVKGVSLAVLDRVAEALGCEAADLLLPAGRAKAKRKGGTK